MSMEFDVLIQNSTWTSVSHTSHVNVVGCKWIYKLKQQPDGSIKQHKARLIATKYQQQLGIDFT